jgi:adenylosuccinate lyase
VIERYTRPEMGVLWDDDHKFGKMLEVELAVAKAQAELGIIPRVAAKNIQQRAKFSVRRIREIEKETKHDVIAFVSNVAENVGEHGKFIHFGMTSSDILDTALSLQVREAGRVLMSSLARLTEALETQMQRHAKTLCPGRTHGMFAEPTTFGYKLAGFWAELGRNRVRLGRALDDLQICKMSGAVGTYSSQGPRVEALVAKKLKLKAETVATQVIPRDRHAEVIWALSMIGSGLERLAVELRHLQRSEVSEVTEGFTRGQKGSSAMPHKKNPISAENITGSARLLRGYLLSALENIALWHERDISHSAVERVIFPDAFILCDYSVHRMAVLLEGLDVNKKRMLENIESSQGQLYSSHVLLALVKKGFKREDAYVHVQRLCHAMAAGDHLKDQIKRDPVLGTQFKNSELDEIFSGKAAQKAIQGVLKKWL